MFWYWILTAFLSTFSLYIGYHGRWFMVDGSPISGINWPITISSIFFVVALLMAYNFVYFVKWLNIMIINLNRCLPPLRGNGPQMSRNTFSNLWLEVMGIMVPSFFSLLHLTIWQMLHIRIFLSTFQSVSYTHLDVYKRQGLSHWT